MRDATASGIKVKSVIVSLILVLSTTCISAQKATWREDVEQSAHVSSDATIVVLDLATGRILAAHRLVDAARTLAAPGSTLKPLVLYGLLAAGRWRPENRVECNRNLAIGGHRLACTHPPAPPFDAREALTWSCNTYFAQVARTLEPGELGRLLRPTGLLGLTGLVGRAEPSEAEAEFREPMSTEAAQLELLGVEGIRITPLELATAYRWLALELSLHPHSRAAQVVCAGMQDSANFGMARQVGLGGVPVAGKTGTAEDAASNHSPSQSHGWFVGMAPSEKPQVVVVVFLPAGRGTDAARVAAELLSHAPPLQASPERP